MGPLTFSAHKVTAAPTGRPLIQIKVCLLRPRSVAWRRVDGSRRMERNSQLTDQLHPMTPHHLPFYVVRPGETDVLMIVMGVFLILAVLGIGNIYLHLHSLPERMAHKSQKLQFEIVAVLGLIALFTHIHIFWIAALLLALIDLPDFSTPLSRIAGSVEKIADVDDGTAASAGEEAAIGQATPAHDRAAPVGSRQSGTAAKEVGSHA
jgi:hypothetical protein